MRWTDILFQLRRKAKIEFDGFGEPRSEDERKAAAEEFTTKRFYGV